ncbi:MAG: tRNA 2-thiouridine(34) synthase MnmA [Calditrichaeota bacterium]|nr:tRNA 2-thiouridine(34) synthase MnmA [Calditrichota bacterium]MCB9368177.1 tRNA 2-thiouridine(34) synthase MnmA [Calditrichota bacterium]
MSVELPTILTNKKTTVKETVAIAMSGGVDSSVAAALLMEQGYDVVGLTMHLWTDEKGEEMSLNRASGCCSITMAQDARAVADRIGFKHYVLNLSKEFHGAVVENFAGEYLRGRTPNPCVRCNTFVKWQTLLERAERLGCDYLATGHYARVERNVDRAMLRRASYPEKDQSYALWGLSQRSLAHTLFPLGDLPKSKVRELARSLDLVTADKPESQDICFVPDNNYRRFLQDNFPSQLKVLGGGEFVGPDGRSMGRHDGIANFTVGQRKGLGLSAGRPLYVTRIDPATDRVFVDYDENCASSQAFGHDTNWVSIAEPKEPVRCDVKIRYRSDAVSATVTPLAGNCVKIEFDEPVRAVTPGQSAVFYREDYVLGGAILSGTEGEEQ